MEGIKGKDSRSKIINSIQEYYYKYRNVLLTLWLISTICQVLMSIVNRPGSLCFEFISGLSTELDFILHTIFSTLIGI